MNLDHKTSHKGQFLEIEIYASSESWISLIYASSKEIYASSESWISLIYASSDEIYASSENE